MEEASLPPSPRGACGNAEKLFDFGGCKKFIALLLDWLFFLRLGFDQTLDEFAEVASGDHDDDLGVAFD